MIQEILADFGLVASKTPQPFGSGHINHTYLVETPQQSYILQRINTQVFKNPAAIAGNLEAAGNYLRQQVPNYLFIQPLLTQQQQPYAVRGNAYWRLLPFVPNSFSINEVKTEEQAYSAAKAFGQLTRHLHGLPLETLQPTIPQFHDLSFRQAQFEEALAAASAERKTVADRWIQFYVERKSIVKTFDVLQQNPDFPTRLMHHDTKINNVLFSHETGEVVAVCDLDTLMPGKIISDIGDMHRTYLAAEPEDSTNFAQIKVRKPFYDALLSGYLSELADYLTPTEQQHLHYGGEFMIYMQGIRFLADYLANDVYYPIKYPTHNLDRAINQAHLLADFERLG